MTGSLLATLAAPTDPIAPWLSTVMTIAFTLAVPFGLWRLLRQPPSVVAAAAPLAAAAAAEPEREPDADGFLAVDPPIAGALQCYICCAPADLIACDRLERSLALLTRQELLQLWHRGKVPTGQPVRAYLDHHLVTADLVVLLISDSFIASQDCYCHELPQALARRSHEQRPLLIPVLLQPLDQQQSPWDGWACLPSDGVAIANQPNQEAAWASVAQGFRQLVLKLKSDRAAQSAAIRS